MGWESLFWSDIREIKNKDSFSTSLLLITKEGLEEAKKVYFDLENRRDIKVSQFFCEKES